MGIILRKELAFNDTIILIAKKLHTWIIDNL